MNEGGYLQEGPLEKEQQRTGRGRMETSSIWPRTAGRSEKGERSVETRARNTLDYHIFKGKREGGPLTGGGKKRGGGQKDSPHSLLRRRKT